MVAAIRPACPLDLRLAQGLLKSRVSRNGQPILMGKALALRIGIIDEYEWHRLARQFPRHATAYASHAADDEVALETFDLALHAPPSKEALQFEF